MPLSAGSDVDELGRVGMGSDEVSEVLARLVAVVGSGFVLVRFSVVVAAVVATVEGFDVVVGSSVVLVAAVVSSVACAKPTAESVDTATKADSRSDRFSSRREDTMLTAQAWGLPVNATKESVPRRLPPVQPRDRQSQDMLACVSSLLKEVRSRNKTS